MQITINCSAPWPAVTLPSNYLLYNNLRLYLCCGHQGSVPRLRHVVAIKWWSEWRVVHLKKVRTIIKGCLNKLSPPEIETCPQNLNQLAVWLPNSLKQPDISIIPIFGGYNLWVMYTPSRTLSNIAHTSGSGALDNCLHGQVGVD